MFWLGKAAKNLINGPHLDLTAFTDLVQNYSVSSTKPHARQESTDSIGYHSLHSSYRSEECRISSSTNGLQRSHFRDSSYESCGSETFLSEDELRDNMPVRNDHRRSSSGSATRPSGLRYSATLDSVYDRQSNSHYTSNPDLNSSMDSKEEYGRFGYGHAEDLSSVRSGSTDSLDSTRSPGSRSVNSSKSNVSKEENIPTRPALRKSSSVANPLQFIKVDSNPLAMQASKIVHKMEEQKKVAVKVETFDDDWQSVSHNPDPSFLFFFTNEVSTELTI